MRPRSAATASALALSALVLAACGSSGSGNIQLAPSGGATQVSTPTTPKPPPALRTKPKVTVSASECSTKQLVKKDLITGSGQVAPPGGTVVVNYVGVLCSTGKEFDSSWKRNQPFTTALTAGSVIPGWVQGIPGMRVGGRRELIIPPNLGYGATGQPPTIPPNSTLVFVVDLLSVS
jgi:FKBP-type peptidyl-prolyl cis-trans isomerase